MFVCVVYVLLKKKLYVPKIDLGKDSVGLNYTVNQHGNLMMVKEITITVCFSHKHEYKNAQTHK